MSNRPAIGCPWHGLVRGGELELPNGEVMTYPQPGIDSRGLDGNTQLIRVPGVSPMTRTHEQEARDTAQGKQWRDYALISGANYQLCGQALGATKHLYFDAAGTGWMIDVDQSIEYLPPDPISGVAQARFVVTLESVFGRVPDRYDPINRVLLDVTFDTGWYGYDFGGSKPLINAPPSMSMERSPSGDTLLCHWYRSGYPQLELWGVWEIGFSGIGSLDETLGAGITAECTWIVRPEEIETFVNDYNSETYTVDFPGGECNSCHIDVEHYPDGWFRTSTRLMRIVFDASGVRRRLGYIQHADLYQLVSGVSIACDGTQYRVTHTRQDDTYSWIDLTVDGAIVASSPSIHRRSIISYDYTGIQCKLGLSDIVYEQYTQDIDGESHPYDETILLEPIFYSPQIVGLLATTSGNNGVISRKIGPCAAAEDVDTDVHEIPSGSEYRYHIHGSYEPVQKQIAVSTEGSCCWV